MKKFLICLIFSNIAFADDGISLGFQSDQIKERAPYLSFKITTTTDTDTEMQDECRASDIWNAADVNPKYILPQYFDSIIAFPPLQNLVNLPSKGKNGVCIKAFNAVPHGITTSYFSVALIMFTTNGAANLDSSNPKAICATDPYEYGYKACLVPLEHYDQLKLTMDYPLGFSKSTHYPEDGTSTYRIQLN